MSEGGPVYDEIDVARLRFVCEPKHDLNVNDDALPVILRLVDQVYGLRHTLRTLGQAVEAQPKSVRERITKRCAKPLGPDPCRRIGRDVCPDGRKKRHRNQPPLHSRAVLCGLCRQQRSDLAGANCCLHAWPGRHWRILGPPPGRQRASSCASWQSPGVGTASPTNSPISAPYAFGPAKTNPRTD